MPKPGTPPGVGVEISFASRSRWLGGRGREIPERCSGGGGWLGWHADDPWQEDNGGCGTQIDSPPRESNRSTAGVQSPKKRRAPPHSPNRRRGARSGFARLRMERGKLGKSPRRAALFS